MHCYLKPELSRILWRRGFANKAMLKVVYKLGMACMPAAIIAQHGRAPLKAAKSLNTVCFS